MAAKNLMDIIKNNQKFLKGVNLILIEYLILKENLYGCLHR